MSRAVSAQLGVHGHDGADTGGEFGQFADGPVVDGAGLGRCHALSVPAINSCVSNANLIVDS
jgi:hypothetical protein